MRALWLGCNHLGLSAESADLESADLSTDLLMSPLR